ncbi:MAG: hypothetical protein SOH80_09890 [Eubacteriales bacterium]
MASDRSRQQAADQDRGVWQAGSGENEYTGTNFVDQTGGSDEETAGICSRAPAQVRDERTSG